MKAHLMYESRDFDYNAKLDIYQQEMIKDLQLNTLFDAMANKDDYIFEIVKLGIFSSLNSAEEILYRQNILKDCIKNPKIVRNIYNIANDTIEKRRKFWWGIGKDYPISLLSTSVEFLQMFMEMLKLLRKVVDESASLFESKGFKNLFDMLQEELNDEYLMTVKTHLNELKFPNGVLISAELGESNLGINYVLRSPKDRKHRWLKWAFAPSFNIHERDDSGLRDLRNREERAINLAANAMAQSAEHVLSFFTMLKNELAFYIGCLNLYDTLSAKGETVSFPEPISLFERRHVFKGLYDVCLSLIVKEKVVSNDINMDGKNLIIITGANQGGKSTFLRSIGQAQLMMQCGMFVAAEYFCSNICDGIFTHFKREEDSSMKSGKLDEELERMSNIADELRENSMILFNESFAATNEREGSEISRQIVCALLEKQIKVFFVTHLYEFAHNFYEQKQDNESYLRAERQTDGSRTFKINNGEPLPTSYGEDLYLKIFNSP